LLDGKCAGKESHVRLVPEETGRPMKRGILLLGACAGLLLVSAASVSAHVVSCTNSRLFAAQRVVILKTSGIWTKATLGSCSPGAPNHTVTWGFTLDREVPKVDTGTYIIRCTGSFLAFAKTHTSGLSYRPTGPARCVNIGSP
jgi:hypothetical protein